MCKGCERAFAEIRLIRAGKITHPDVSNRMKSMGMRDIKKEIHKSIHIDPEYNKDDDFEYEMGQEDEYQSTHVSDISEDDQMILDEESRQDYEDKMSGKYEYLENEETDTTYWEDTFADNHCEDEIYEDAMETALAITHTAWEKTWKTT